MMIVLNKDRTSSSSTSQQQGVISSTNSSNKYVLQDHTYDTYVVVGDDHYPPPPPLHRRLRQQQQEQQEQKQPQPRRLVIFAGPHKSASSSVETFFQRFASNRRRDGHKQQQRLPALKGWIWPWNPKLGRSYQPSKAFAILVNERQQHQQQCQQYQRDQQPQHQQQRQDLCQRVYDSIYQALKDDPTTNLIVGTEEFDRFGTTPWSHRDGIGAIRDLIDVIQGQIHQVLVGKDDTTNLSTTSLSSSSSHGHDVTVEIVINYRRPRKDQWISIWRQLSRKDQKAYSDFMCPPENEQPPVGRFEREDLTNNNNNNTYFLSADYWRLWEYLDAVANPLGLAEAMLTELGGSTSQVGGNNDNNSNNNIDRRRLVVSKVHIMDMLGIVHAGLDISHVIACQVLGAKPCPNGWLSLLNSTTNNSESSSQNEGNPFALQENKKTGDPKLSPDQLDDMETLFLLRDCSYRNKLESYRPTMNDRSTSFSSLHIHYGESIWDGCPSSDQQMMILESLPSLEEVPWNNNYTMASSTDDMLDFLQDQVGCGSRRVSSTKSIVQGWKRIMNEMGDKNGVASVEVVKTTKKDDPVAAAEDTDVDVVIDRTTPISPKQHMGQQQKQQRQEPTSKSRIMTSHNNDNMDDSTLYRTARIQSVVLLFIIIVLFVANLFHQFSKSKKKKNNNNNNNRTMIGRR